MATELAPPIMSENATKVLLKRVAQQHNGAPSETPQEVFHRVADALANGNEELTATFYEVLASTKFLPNSPCLVNAGCRTGQLSACFVIPIADDLGEIFATLRRAMLIQQTGGGCGYSFSPLRAAGALINTSQGQAGGPIGYMRSFDVSTRELSQGGVRRGAQMGILRADHPDILAFIREKQDLTQLTQFNVSVALPEHIVQAIVNDDPGQYELIDPKYGPTGRFLAYRELRDVIVDCAWRTGEPGLFFIDRANAENPNPGMGDYEATNPCGEQPLLPYESCNLGSVDLAKFVVQDEWGEARVDWDELRRVVRVATRFMNAVVDKNTYVPAVPEIREVSLRTRKLGLGVMGFARMLFNLGVAYDSTEAQMIGSIVMGVIDTESKETSIELAKTEGGYPYAEENPEEWRDRTLEILSKRLRSVELLTLVPDYLKEQQVLIARSYSFFIQFVEGGGIWRNSNTTTVAPTGTLSILADTSGGCEPVFALSFKRQQAGMVMYETDPVFLSDLKEMGFTQEMIDGLLNLIDQHAGSLRKLLKEGSQIILSALFEEALGGPAPWLQKLQALGEIYATASDISPENHVLMQACFQQFNDSAVSKTINLPKEATREDVLAAYILAMRTGCKGITVYRDGCRSFQPLSTNASTEPAAASQAPEPTIIYRDREPWKRPDMLPSFGTAKLQTADGTFYLVVNHDDEGIAREVFINYGKSGGVLASLVEALGRVISVGLQYGVPLQTMARQLTGIRSAESYGFGPKQVLSIPDAIGKCFSSLKKPVAGAPTIEEEPAAVPTPVDYAVRQAAIKQGYNPECPECHSPMQFGEGCKGGKCTDPGCGYAKC